MTWLGPLAVFPVQEVLVRHQNSVRLADVGLAQLPTKLLDEAVAAVVIALGSFSERAQRSLGAQTVRWGRVQVQSCSCWEVLARREARSFLCVALCCCSSPSANAVAPVLC